MIIVLMILIPILLLLIKSVLQYHFSPSPNPNKKNILILLIKPYIDSSFTHPFIHLTGNTGIPHELKNKICNRSVEYLKQINRHFIPSGSFIKYCYTCHFPIEFHDLRIVYNYGASSSSNRQYDNSNSNDNTTSNNNNNNNNTANKTSITMPPPSSPYQSPIQFPPRPSLPIYNRNYGSINDRIRMMGKLPDDMKYQLCNWSLNDLKEIHRHYINKDTSIECCKLCHFPIGSHIRYNTTIPINPR
jgi:hypothetical protein